MKHQLMPLLPIWLIALVFTPLLLLCLWQLLVRRGQRLAWVRRALMVMLLVVVALRPVTVTETIATTRTNANVIFVVDQTGSMNAEDYNGQQTRIEGMKADAEQIIERTAGARYGIIAFDSSSSQALPLTTDAGAVRAWFDTLQTEPTARSTGSKVDRSAEALADMLRRTAEDDPGVQILVFVLSDGENTEEGATKTFTGGEHVDGGAVLGYGTAQGGRMKAQGGAEHGQYIKDASGQEGRSRIDEQNLKKVADDLGITYLHRTAPNQSLDDALDGLTFTAIPAEEHEKLPDFDDWYWIPAIVLAVLALVEMSAALRALPRTARSRTAPSQPDRNRTGQRPTDQNSTDQNSTGQNSPEQQHVRSSPTEA